MRILFDHQVFSWQAYGGISRYFAEQLRGLKSLGQEVFLPEHFFSENVYLRQFPEFRRQSLTSFSFKGKKFLQNWLGRKASLAAIQKCRPAVFHPTYFDVYFLKTLEKQRLPFVLTVHDMIHEIYGHGSRSLFSLDEAVVANKRLLAQKAAAVICVSENTRQDLLKFCPELEPAKIKIVYHGNSLAYQTEAGASQEKPPAILFVGQRQAYKNFSWMLEQLTDLLHEEPSLQIQCVGGGPFQATEREQMTRLGVGDRVHYLRVSDDHALARLYAESLCFVFPSQYEGFGIPVLEAFACGCPAVLHRASSLPEVGGDAAIYFDENEAGSLASAVRALLHDRALRQEFIRRGRARAADFTWEKSAAQHLEVYQKVLNQT